MILFQIWLLKHDIDLEHRNSGSSQTHFLTGKHPKTSPNWFTAKKVPFQNKQLRAPFQETCFFPKTPKEGSASSPRAPKQTRQTRHGSLGFGAADSAPPQLISRAWRQRGQKSRSLRSSSPPYCPSSGVSPRRRRLL